MKVEPTYHSQHVQNDSEEKRVLYSKSQPRNSRGFKGWRGGSSTRYSQRGSARHASSGVRPKEDERRQRPKEDERRQRPKEDERRQRPKEDERRQRPKEDERRQRPKEDERRQRPKEDERRQRPKEDERRHRYGNITVKKSNPPDRSGNISRCVVCD